MSLRTAEESTTKDSDYYDPYIRIPSDLFGERRSRHPPSILLPMNSVQGGRSAGVYPPPRPLSYPEPWALQCGRGGKREKGFSPPKIRRRSQRGVDVGASPRGETSRPRHHDSAANSDRHKKQYGQQQQEQRQQSLVHPFLLQKRASGRLSYVQNVLDTKSESDRDVSHSWPNLSSPYPSRPELVLQLPHVLCTLPCAIHSRHLHAPRRDLDLLYSTSCHGGKVTLPKGNLPAAGEKVQLVNQTVDRGGSSSSYVHHNALPPRRRQSAPRSGMGDSARRKGKVILGGSGEISSPDTDFSMMLLRVEQQQRYQVKLFRARLPDSLSARDVVLSWLQYGSAPVTESHFPGLT